MINTIKVKEYRPDENRLVAEVDGESIELVVNESIYKIQGEFDNCLVKLPKPWNLRHRGAITDVNSKGDVQQLNAHWNRGDSLIAFNFFAPGGDIKNKQLMPLGQNVLAKVKFIKKVYPDNRIYRIVEVHVKKDQTGTPDFYFSTGTSHPVAINFKVFKTEKFLRVFKWRPGKSSDCLVSNEWETGKLWNPPPKK